MPDYLPTREADLVPFSANYSAKISLVPEDYGFVAADATALAGLVTAFETAKAAVSDPDTRTKTSVVAKNQAKVNLVAMLRSMSQRIQTNPAVTAELKTGLGLPIWDREPSSVPVPPSKPVISLVAMSGNQHLIRIIDEATPTSRAKPWYAAGAEVYAFVSATPGEVPPGDLAAWQSKGLAVRSTFEVNYAPADAGKEVTLVARWYNAKGEFGQPSEKITARIAGGVSMAA